MALFRRVNFSRFSVRLALFAGLTALFSVVLHRFSIVDFKVALPGLTISVLLSLLALMSGIAGLVIAMRQRESTLSALIGILLGFVVAAPTILALLAGAGLPRIHDISTDLDNPPQFEAIRLLRNATDNDLDRLIPKNLAQLQQAGYPDLKPLLLEHSKAEAFNQALQLVKNRGWTIESVSIEQGIIEATAVTPIMAFKDDVVIRILPNGKFTQIDMRSVSRVGISDLGTNAARIRHFLNDLVNFNIMPK